MRLSRRLKDVNRVILQGRWCTYCGEVAGTIDHFPPATYSSRGAIIPACRECNSIAGTQYPLDFRLRVRWVQGEIRRRNERLLQSPHWCDDEAEELGYSLKSEVLQWQQRKERALKRIAWNAEVYLMSIDADRASVLLDAECDIITTLERLHSQSGESYRAMRARLRQNDLARERRRRKKEATM